MILLIQYNARKTPPFRRKTLSQSPRSIFQTLILIQNKTHVFSSLNHTLRFWVNHSRMNFSDIKRDFPICWLTLKNFNELFLHAKQEQWGVKKLMKAEIRYRGETERQKKKNVVGVRRMKLCMRIKRKSLHHLSVGMCVSHIVVFGHDSWSIQRMEKNDWKMEANFHNRTHRASRQQVLQMAKWFLEMFVLNVS